MKKRDLIVTLLYFLDMAVLILSVMFPYGCETNFGLKHLRKKSPAAAFG